MLHWTIIHLLRFYVTAAIGQWHWNRAMIADESTLGFIATAVYSDSLIFLQLKIHVKNCSRCKCRQISLKICQKLQKNPANFDRVCYFNRHKPLPTLTTFHRNSAMQCMQYKYYILPDCNWCWLYLQVHRRYSGILEFCLNFGNKLQRQL